MSESINKNSPNYILGRKDGYQDGYGDAMEQLGALMLEAESQIPRQYVINKGDPDTITLKRIYSTHCQVCRTPFSYENIPFIFNPLYRIVYFIPHNNNIVCHKCAWDSGLEYEPRIYKEGE